ncbi:MAG TPA: polysaccharide deacetylase family protein [Candidatus Didemnitutus sp.]|jgi:peptidoglycan/xylan/chitin deacetylase (PgdA/CDA1 family)
MTSDAKVRNSSSAAAADEAAGRRRVALVFDDGPAPQNHGKLLALLAEEGARVTFSFVGQAVAAHPELARAAVAAGHEVMNHTQTHPHLKETSSATIEREVCRAQEEIVRAAAFAPRWFWAPNGEWDERIAAAVRAAGLEHYPTARFHFVSSEDWDKSVDAETIFRRATGDVRAETLLLFHEWREETLGQLSRIFAELRRQGCEFVTFSDLAGGGT